MDQYRIFLLPEAQADEEQLMLNLRAVKPLWEPKDVSLYFTQSAGAFAGVPAFGLILHPGPHPSPGWQDSDEIPPQFHGFPCFHLPTAGIVPLLTKLKKFLIKILHLKGNVWEMLKMIGLHSWIKNINKMKKVLLCSSPNSSCTA